MLLNKKAKLELLYIVIELKNINKTFKYYLKRLNFFKLIKVLCSILFLLLIKN